MDLIARRLEPKEWPEASRVLARSLPGPVFERFEALPAAGGIAVGVFAGSDLLGAARAVPHAGCLCQIELPADSAQGALDYQAFIRANHPDRRHWYVGPVGVEPGRQGAGIGTAAMRELMNSIVGAGLVCVEAEDSIVAFFERVGFRPTLRTPAPDGVPITFLEAHV
jgi:ribosomal protein S18 acetylase RimI-like enzyme